ncbi:MAG: ABC transporter permease, partial [Bryobacteraceae bacterium]
AARRKEIAVRAALGASRFRIVRQLLSESLLLSALGGIAGTALAVAVLKILTRLAPANLLQGREIALDLRALLFTFGIAVMSAILAGLPSTWRVLHGSLESDLRETSRGFTAGQHRLRASLVVTQMALAVTLLIGAGLLVRSFVRLLDVNPGFDARHVATLATQLPATVRSRADAVPYDRMLLDRLSHAPGVRSVAAISRLPMTGMQLGSWLWIEGRTWKTGEHPEVEYRVASTDYFQTMGIPLLAGRYFDDHDDSNAAGVVVISDSLARKYFPSGDAVGSRIQFGNTVDPARWITVIGVVGNVHHFGLDQDPRPEIYRPIAYSALMAPYIVARTDGDPAAILPSLAATLRSVDR